MNFKVLRIHVFSKKEYSYQALSFFLPNFAVVVYLNLFSHLKFLPLIVVNFLTTFVNFTFFSKID